MLSSFTGSNYGVTSATIFNQDPAYSALEQKIGTSGGGDNIQCQTVNAAVSVTSSTGTFTTKTVTPLVQTSKVETTSGDLSLDAASAQKIKLLKPATGTVLTLEGTTPSTDQTTGTLVVGGGIGAGGDIRGNFLRSQTSVFATTTVQTPEVTTSGNTNLTLRPYDAGSGIVQATKRVDVTDTTESTSTSTGSLTLAGGAGIAKNLNVGGNVTVTGTLTAASLSPLTAATVTGSTKVVTPLIESATGDVTLTPAQNVTSTKPLRVTDNTSSTTTTTGALQVTGGVGIVENLNVGGNTQITGNLGISGAFSPSSVSTTTLTVPTIQTASGDLSISPFDEVNVTRPMKVTNSTTSTSSTTGALKVTGGVGVAENVNIGGTLGVTGSASLSTATASTKLTTPLIDTSAGNLNITPSGKVMVTKVLQVDDNTLIDGSNNAALTVPAGSIYAGGTIRSYTGFNVQSAVTLNTTSLSLSDDFSIGANNGTNTLIINNTKQSTSSTTGGLNVKGGAGIEKNLYVGGVVSVPRMIGIQITTQNIQISNFVTSTGNNTPKTIPFTFIKIGRMVTVHWASTAGCYKPGSSQSAMNSAGTLLSASTRPTYDCLTWINTYVNVHNLSLMWITPAGLVTIYIKYRAPPSSDFESLDWGPYAFTLYGGSVSYIAADEAAIASMSDPIEFSVDEPKAKKRKIPSANKK